MYFLSVNALHLNILTPPSYNRCNVIASDSVGVLVPFWDCGREYLQMRSYMTVLEYWPVMGEETMDWFLNKGTLLNVCQNNWRHGCTVFLNVSLLLSCDKLNVKLKLKAVLHLAGHEIQCCIHFKCVCINISNTPVEFLDNYYLLGETVPYTHCVWKHYFLALHIHIMKTFFWHLSLRLFWIMNLLKCCYWHIGLKNQGAWAF